MTCQRLTSGARTETGKAVFSHHGWTQSQVDLDNQWELSLSSHRGRAPCAVQVTGDHLRRRGTS